MLHGADKPCSICPLLKVLHVMLCFGTPRPGHNNLHPSPGKLSVNALQPARVPDADLHSTSRSLVQCQHEPPKKPSSPRHRENLIGTGSRALAVGSLYGELISWKDLRALFKVCRVSEGATHHSAQPRLWHIWSGSFRVTCARTDR